MDVQRMKGWWPWGLVLGALGIAHGPTLFAHVVRGFDANIFNDDARQQIYPFFRYADPSLFPNDYIGDYYLDCLPIGFRALYTLSAPFLDPAVSSKVVAYLLLLITVAGLGVAANRLGGKVAAWAAMSLVLGASLYLDRMGGGLPRAFGFPILAWALAALIYGRTRWLAALVWLGACFYPVAGVITGLATALLLLFLPASDRGDAEAWERPRRLRFLAVVAGVSLVLLLPTIITSSSYSPVITSDSLAEYPEAGQGGRYGAHSRAPYHGFVESAATAVWRGVKGVGRPWVEPIGEWTEDRAMMILVVVAVFSALGWLLFLASSGEARRAMMLGVAAFIGYWLARSAPPYLYLPTRYADYTMPVLAVLMISTSVAAFYSMRDKLGWADGHVAATSSFRAGATLVFCLFVLVTLGGRGSTTAGLNVEANDTALYDAVAALPVDAVIAGWPRTAIENVPYVARRSALLTFETHQAFHEKYVDVMRERMRALIDAWLATSDDPLIRLRDEHGVTHLLVYLPHLRGRRLEYFRPFDAWVAEAHRAGTGTLPALLALVDGHAIYRDDRYALVDLRGLNGPL